MEREEKCVKNRFIINCFIQNVKAIPGEFLHLLVVADLDKKKIRNVARTTCTERRNINLLKYLKIRKQFEEKAIELVDIGVPNMWGQFKHGVIEACDEVCGNKRGRRSKGDTQWWNEEVKEAVSKKKETYKVMC